MEGLRLRVKDIDFEQQQIIVRAGKGNKDRTTILPEPLQQPLKQHLQQIKTWHQKDLAAGRGTVYLPYALERKYPNANREFRTIQELLGHKSIETTMIYTPVLSLSKGTSSSAADWESVAHWKCCDLQPTLLDYNIKIQSEPFQFYGKKIMTGQIQSLARFIRL